MEYLTGVKPKETKEISELLEQTEAGIKVKVNGAVHTIRDMGTVAFVILRKREGLLQCVYEEGSADFELKDMKEAATVEVEGILEENEKAPNGIEIRMESVKILSEPEDEMMPLAISKWKLNTSLEAKLNYRSISLRNIRERAKFRIQEGLTRAFRDSFTARNLQRSIHRRSERKEPRGEPTFSNWNISTDRQCWRRVHSSISR